MKYWDSSAVLPLLVREAASDRMATLLPEDPAIVTWWGSSVECVSAIARLERESALDRADAAAALARLKAASSTWTEVPATPPVREHAIRLLRVHRLRAGDALQLAAAIIASDFQPSSLDFVTLDERLGLAAAREGFSLIS
ncbi:MAG TPA: type II toxin-antitoxin system VapC family toxin [Gemmatimonadaceae bacterium]|nr:type II toxin-antitoxin system VapC family toxin [Gemmatimonadaceae bacterium]